MRTLGLLAVFALGCGSARPNYDGDYDVRVGSIDVATCMGSMHLAAGDGAWSCGDVAGAAVLDDSRQGEVYLSLQTGPNDWSEVRSKPGGIIAGPIVFGGETTAFIATKRPCPTCVTR
jgi:hypothetical protein